MSPTRARGAAGSRIGATAAHGARAQTQAKARVDVSQAALTTTFCAMGFEQIQEYSAMQDPRGERVATDEGDDDSDGFYPDEDSDIHDHDRGADEPPPSGSIWDLAEDGPIDDRQQPDLVLRPGTKMHEWCAVLIRPAAAIGLRLSERDKLALKARDRAILAVAQVLASRQGEYLSTLEVATLQPILQKDVARLAKVDEGRVSRILETTFVELPDEHVVALGALVGDSDYRRARAIRDAFLKGDEVVRGPHGDVLEIRKLVSWEEAIETAKAELGKRSAEGPAVKGIKDRNLASAAAKYGLPTNVKARRKAYLEGADWWTKTF